VKEDDAMTTTKLIWLGAVLGAVLAGPTRAADLPRLPQALQLVQSKDSPGVVTFRHDSHVDAKKPSCATCHPKRFSILGRSADKAPVHVKHAAMEKGEACGACHGKAAFGFEDCTMCHAQ
jgi:c(7)-type cytochrome triheme protein